MIIPMNYSDRVRIALGAKYDSNKLLYFNVNNLTVMNVDGTICLSTFNEPRYLTPLEYFGVDKIVPVDTISNTFRLALSHTISKYINRQVDIISTEIVFDSFIVQSKHVVEGSEILVSNKFTYKQLYWGVLHDFVKHLVVGGFDDWYERHLDAIEDTVYMCSDDDVEWSDLKKLVYVINSLK